MIAYIRQIGLVAVARALKHATQDHNYAHEILDQPSFLSTFSKLGNLAGIDIEDALRAILRGEYDHDVVSDHLFGILIDSVEKAGFNHSSTWDALDHDPADGGATKSQQEVTYAALSSLNLINVDEVSWENIIEFRKDSESRAALRQLRLFFSENYEGKDKSFIVDDLMARVERQEAIAKSWGFRTAVRSLGVAFTDKSLLVTSLGGIAAVTAGAPLSVAAGAGAVITAGSCVLEFGKARIERQLEELERPTRYLTMLKKKLRA